jgi:fumarate hydratase class II
MSDATVDGYRIEHDTMGEVRVPADAKWAAQTQRAVENFPISGLTIDRSLIAALAAIKGAAAVTNGRLKVIDKDVAKAIPEAAAEVADGPLGRAVPRRRVPDRLGHLLEHERQRGARDPRLERLGRTVKPERRGQRQPVEQRRVPRRRSTWPPRPGIKDDLIPALQHLAGRSEPRRRSSRRW